MIFTLLRSDRDINKGQQYEPRSPYLFEADTTSTAFSIGLSLSNST